MKRHNFKNLKIWKEAMLTVKETYKITKEFPDFERFALANQLIRSAISIPSNIAEGTSKTSDKHFSKFIQDSLGSAFEWETQLQIAFDQGYIDQSKFRELENKIQVLQKMISGFQRKLQPGMVSLDS